MLVLSRFVNESIIIETPTYTIRVLVVRIAGDKVRLGIEADDDVRIVREELLGTQPPRRP